MITNDSGDLTVLASPSSHVVFMDIESFPTGILIPNSGHNSIPIAFTASNKSKSSSLSPDAAIQFAESLIKLISLIALAAIFVIASLTAILADAAASVIAIGAFSPIAIASPVIELNVLFVTPTLETGTCHGPTI